MLGHFGPIHRELTVFDPGVGCPVDSTGCFFADSESFWPVYSASIKNLGNDLYWKMNDLSNSTKLRSTTNTDL